MQRNPFHGIRFFTSAQLAKHLNVAVATLAKWRERGEGPPYHVLGHGTVRYSSKDVKEWVDAKKVVPKNTRPLLQLFRKLKK